LKSFGKIIRVSFALALGIIIIWLSLKALSSSEKQNIIDSFKIANYWWILASVILGVMSHLLRALRWQLLLKPMNYNISLQNSFLSVMIGYFANMGVPRSGELIRCSILYKEEKVPVDKGFGTVVLERGIDLLIFILLFTIVFFAEYKRVKDFVQTNVFDKIDARLEFLYTENGLLYFVLGAAIVLGVVFLIFKKPISKSRIFKSVISFLKNFSLGLKSISQLKQPILFVIYTVSIWILYYFMVYICFFSLESTSQLGLLSGMTVLALGTIAIMLTPGGIGFYPLIVMQTLVLYNVDSSSGWAMGWLTWSAQSLMIVIFGSVSLLILSLKHKSNGIFKRKYL